MSFIIVIGLYSSHSLRVQFYVIQIIEAALGLQKWTTPLLKFLIEVNLIRFGRCSSLLPNGFINEHISRIVNNVPKFTVLRVLHRRLTPSVSSWGHPAFLVLMEAQNLVAVSAWWEITLKHMAISFDRPFIDDRRHDIEIISVPILLLSDEIDVISFSYFELAFMTPKAYLFCCRRWLLMLLLKLVRKTTVLIAL